MKIKAIFTAALFALSVSGAAIPVASKIARTTNLDDFLSEKREANAAKDSAQAHADAWNSKSFWGYDLPDLVPGGSRVEARKFNPKIDAQAQADAWDAGTEPDVFGLPDFIIGGERIQTRNAKA